MTMTRQLMTLILILFLLIFAGTFWISVENTRSYLIEQLSTQTQNSADSLGLSLVPFMEERDIASIDTHVNALFDSGYYQALSIRLISGENLLERHNSKSVEGVPVWFTEHLPLQTTTAKTLITSGWKQSGTLELTAHPGMAYQKLWQTTHQIFWWSVIAYMIATIATMVILKAILKPLNEVEHQAEAICEREYPIVDDIPKTRELRRVVKAMNRLSMKVKINIDNLSERAETMRREAHFDGLTGLLNRQGFLTSLDHAIKDQDHAGSGSLALIRLSHFSEFNRISGFESGDDLLKTVATILEKLTRQASHTVAARTKGAEFAVLLPLASLDEAKSFARQCSAEFQQLSTSLDIEGIAHIGMVPFQADDSMQSILSHADSALASALHQGPNSFFFSSQNVDANSAVAWEELITKAMLHKTIRMQTQPIMDADREVLYRELRIRVQDEHGAEIAPGTFAAMADRLALNHDLDCYVIENATSALESNSDQQPLGINLSTRSVHHETFISRLEKQLQSHPIASSSLVFEISEHALLEKIEKSQELIKLIHTHGGKVVMEHFGSKLSSFRTLRQLKLDYIKLDGRYIRNISEQRDNQFFLQTVTDIAHSLDMKVIAEHVESEADLACLKTIGIDAMQGYLFGDSSPLLN